MLEPQEYPGKRDMAGMEFLKGAGGIPVTPGNRILALLHAG